MEACVPQDGLRGGPGPKARSLLPAYFTKEFLFVTQVPPSFPLRITKTAVRNQMGGPLTSSRRFHTWLTWKVVVLRTQIGKFQREA